MNHSFKAICTTLMLSSAFFLNAADTTTTAPAKTTTTTPAVKSATAKLNPTEGNEVTGTVTFTATSGGIRIVADITGLTPGRHGFHIHEKGDCGGKGAENAGGHFNPTNQRHGSPDNFARHVGDLGNVHANEHGHARYERIDSAITFEGANNIIGRSIVVHAGEDDFHTQPTGNSGARVACGVIEASK